MLPEPATCFQGISGKSSPEGGRQTARRLGDYFKAPGRRVKGLVIGQEGSEVETVNEAHRAGDVVADVLQRVRVRRQKA